MFGYVNIFKDELKIKDYTLFRAFYCGLCKAIGRQGSHIARLGLSYDMTFLALVLAGIDENELCTVPKRCMAHPTVKHSEIVNNRAVDYSADMSVLLAYLKLYDDWLDEHSIKALLGMFFYKSAVRKAKKRYSAEYDKILDLLKKLSEFEKENSGNIDEVADCFAKILALLFTPSFIIDENVRRTLEWLGYNIGRWIYIIDAFNDIKNDIKKKNYNTFIARYGINSENFDKIIPKISADTSFTLDIALSEIANAYELLKIYHNDDILRNIIYIGLREKQDFIIKKENGNESV